MSNSDALGIVIVLAMLIIIVAPHLTRRGK
jgi:hypothetical protein